MDKKHGLRGIWAAALTAFDESGALDVDATLWHWRWLLGSGGCAGVVPFGTTGEGPSLSNEERCLLLEAALGAGIERERLWPGTGGASLTDVISLTRRVRALGLSGVLILPPFFYASEEAGLLAWYSAVFSALEDGGEGGDNDFGIMLYNIPKLSRCTITLGLVSSLVERFPHRLAGVKDSDGDWENMHALTGTFPALSIMCGDERLLLAHSRAGGAGGIMARGCVAGLWLARLFAAGSGG
ncbi:MAG: dihydrodipicolinate synthase family protein, partial [Alphaproteobacteria bacterium]